MTVIWTKLLNFANEWWAVIVDDCCHALTDIRDGHRDDGVDRMSAVLRGKFAPIRRLVALGVSAVSGTFPICRIFVQVWPNQCRSVDLQCPAKSVQKPAVDEIASLDRPAGVRAGACQFTKQVLRRLIIPSTHSVRESDRPVVRFAGCGRRYQRRRSWPGNRRGLEGQIRDASYLPCVRAESGFCC